MIIYKRVKCFSIVKNKKEDLRLRIFLKVHFIFFSYLFLNFVMINLLFLLVGTRM